jgi:UDP-glucose 4-epimerase
MKKIAWITGVQGFIGQNLAKYLHKLGYDVFGIGHGSWNMEEAEQQGFRYLISGRISFSNFDKLVNQSLTPNAVFHLAGGGAVGPSFIEPQQDFFDSVDSTIQLLEWLRINSSQTKVILASSAAVYGAGHSGPITEQAPLNPYSPYGWHKAIAEMLCESYFKNFGIRSTVMRLFSVYGPGLQKQLIWDICKKLQSNTETLELYGTGRELRDWIHINDAVRLLVFINEREGANFEVFNGGSGIGESILNVAQIVCRHWGKNISIKFSGKTRKGDPEKLVADVSRLYQKEFKINVPLSGGLLETVTWYKEKMGC